MTYLRFTSLKPSLLEVDDRTRSHDSRVRSLAMEFRPRPKDEGSLSMWRVEGEEDEARHVVVHATRPAIPPKSSRMDDVQYARIEATWLEELGLPATPSRASDTFECVADLHHDVPGSDPDLMRRLADRILREQERTGKHDASAPFAYVHRSDPNRSFPISATVPNLIENVYARCSSAGTIPDLSGGAEWARALVMRDGIRTT